MLKKCTVALSLVLVLALLAACGSGGAGGSTGYPNKAITFIAPSGAGGAFDTALRVITKALTDTNLVTQQMLVEAQPGGGGTVFMAEYATKDTNNDYKLFLTSPTMLINHLKKEGNSPYGYGDTTPLAQLFVDYAVICVNSDSPYNSFEEVFDLLKENPQALTVAGGSGPGAVDHLAFMIPAEKYGIDPARIKYVSYDGKAEAVAGLIGGNVEVLSSVSASVTEYLEAGRLKVLAVDAPERLGGVYADVPTLKELGIDTQFSLWRGIFGPKNMTPEAKEFWTTKLKELSQTDEWAEILKANNWEAAYLDSDDFLASLNAQDAALSNILTKLGLA